jgi:hypothetical protein
MAARSAAPGWSAAGGMAEGTCSGPRSHQRIAPSAPRGAGEGNTRVPIPPRQSPTPQPLPRFDQARAIRARSPRLGRSTVGVAIRVAGSGAAHSRATTFPVRWMAPGPTARLMQGRDTHAPSARDMRSAGGRTPMVNWEPPRMAGARHHPLRLADQWRWRADRLRRLPPVETTPVPWTQAAWPGAGAGTTRDSLAPARRRRRPCRCRWPVVNGS